MTEPDARPTDQPAAAQDSAPAKSHGDPLLAASQGATEGTEGTRHGADASGASTPPDD